MAGLPPVHPVTLHADHINIIVHAYLVESAFAHSAFALAHEADLRRTLQANPRPVPGLLVHALRKAADLIRLEHHVDDEGNIISCDAPWSLLTATEHRHSVGAKSSYPKNSHHQHHDGPPPTTAPPPSNPLPSPPLPTPNPAPAAPTQSNSSTATGSRKSSKRDRKSDRKDRDRDRASERAERAAERERERAERDRAELAATAQTTHSPNATSTPTSAPATVPVLGLSVPTPTPTSMTTPAPTIAGPVPSRAPPTATQPDPKRAKRDHQAGATSSERRKDGPGSSKSDSAGAGASAVPVGGAEHGGPSGSGGVGAIGTTGSTAAVGPPISHGIAPHPPIPPATLTSSTVPFSAMDVDHTARATDTLAQTQQDVDIPMTDAAHNAAPAPTTATPSANSTPAASTATAPPPDAKPRSRRRSLSPSLRLLSPGSYNAALRPNLLRPVEPGDVDDVGDWEREKIEVMLAHTSEVFALAWHPGGGWVASGAGDATGRIWPVPATPGTPVGPPSLLQHKTAGADGKDVTTLEWSPSGNLLATGAYDGKVRVWSTSGTLLREWKKHNGPVFSIRWNKRGNLLLSGSVDKVAVVWDVAGVGQGQQPEVGGGEVGARQMFRFHTQPILDVDWKDDVTFATCGSDRNVYVCQLGSLTAYRKLTGHVQEVNCLRWAPDGNWIATCSDDMTVRIWDPSATANALRVLQGHTKEVYTVRWNPDTGGGRMLASGSFDSTVRIWSADTGACLHVLARHTEPVYSVAFSPNGMYLAAGSFDTRVSVWRVKDDFSVHKSVRGANGIFEVTWSADSSKIAACFADWKLMVLYMD
ncbi:WD40 repeat-like protein [Gonapodya prolifera JEL478]|uniref:WD40 repeat-like protein n=1 Tax=Gonapodya prolifera (strain JEL478) TaxID=1344416 RepID=A0A139A894_GONPJ|nr:WD40 repeat-like protein [Gonapodya prolifera JEL478]|eukprot:KXS13031.1 WD40 repeat-like protein [Gonapodya prolifera JEL478]